MGRRNSLSNGQITASANANDIVLGYESPGFIFSCFRNLTIVVWGKTGTMSQVHALARVSELVARKHRMLSSAQIVLPGAGPPDAHTRTAMQDLTAAYEKRLVALATMVEGTGFATSGVRSLVTALHFLRRPP